MLILDSADDDDLAMVAHICQTAATTDNQPMNQYSFQVLFAYICYLETAPLTDVNVGADFIAINLVSFLWNCRTIVMLERYQDVPLRRALQSDDTQLRNNANEIPTLPTIIFSQNYQDPIYLMIRTHRQFNHYYYVDYTYMADNNKSIVTTPICDL
jgi:hypothetical protein